MKVALVQMSSIWGEARANLRITRRFVAEARKGGADLVVFPELSVHGIWKDHMVRMVAEPLEGPIVGTMQSLACRQRLALAFGLAEKTNGKPFNTYVVVDASGEIVGVYRKNFVTHLEGEFFRRDRRRPVFDWNGVRTAVAICADCCNEVLLAGYGRRKVKLLLMPHAWDADPVLRDGTIPAFPSMQKLVETYARGEVARYLNHREMLDKFTSRLAPMAAKYGFHAVFVNATGLPHRLIPLVGPCFAVNAEGEVIARTRGKKEQILFVGLDL